MIDLNDAAPQTQTPPRYDLDALVEALRASASGWVPQLFPAGRRDGEHWRLANIHGDKPRKNGSCVINLVGRHAGNWHDFEDDSGGGPLSTLEHATGLTGRALFAYAADLVGLTADQPTRHQPYPERPAPKPGPSHEIQYILNQCQPVAASPAMGYLTARGVATAAVQAEDLRFHPDLTHFQSQRGWGALVALVRNQGGEITGLHRTWLTDDGAAKAPVEGNRKMLGSVSGGAVRLMPVGESANLAIAEGLETALSVMEAVPGLPVWAALSAGGMERLVIPSGIKEVLILADHDTSGAGLRAAEALASHVALQGRRAWIALPPEPDTDFNDLLQHQGVEAVQEALKTARLAGQPEEPSARPVGPVPSLLQPLLPMGLDPCPASRALLRADEGDLAKAVDQTWEVVIASNTPPWLYQRAGAIVWAEIGDDGQAVIVQPRPEGLRPLLARLAAFAKRHKSGDLVPAHPPTALVQSLMNTPSLPLPILERVVRVPVFGADGTLLTEPGYHPASRVLYRPAPGFSLAPVSDHPSEASVAAARRLLSEDLLGDFPFVGDAERAHAIAILLLGFVRSLIDGPTPLHLIEKPAAGTGATLMVECLCQILTGGELPIMTEAKDDEEWRKRITARLRSAPVIFMIDNVNTLEGPSLAAALTSSTWEDRILGASEMVRIANRSIWVATGNNPSLSAEIVRRTVRIRLDAGVARPQFRTGFRHKTLKAWVRENRSALVHACLTLVQAWLAAGRPKGTEQTLGSYEAWVDVMGGILATAGIDGFLGNLEDLAQGSDDESAALEAFVHGWWHQWRDVEVGVSDLFDLALVNDPPIKLGSGSEHERRVRLGFLLKSWRDRVVEVEGRRLRLTYVRRRKRAQVWQLESLA